MILNQTLVDLHRQHLGAQQRDAAREVRLDATPYPQATSASVAIQLVGAFTSPSGAAARADLLSMVQSAIALGQPRNARTHPGPGSPGGHRLGPRRLRPEKGPGGDLRRGHPLVARVVEEGYLLVCSGIDIGLFARAATEIVSSLRLSRT